LSSKRDFLHTANYVHNEIQEVFKSDKNHQEELRNTFTQEPSHERQRYEIIESQAMGYKKNADGVFVTLKGENLKENDMELLMENIDNAMLRNNPLYEKYNLEFKEGFIIPKNLKEFKEDNKL
tara:strand:+ start:621 stop:989 length:369 start_codon:yes stop_codon:yes gene_type:complete